MTTYRQVLAVPGMAALLSVSLLARAAITADVMVLTLYVVLGLDMSYAAAGAVAAALTAGLALGGPLLGRALDRRGLRPVLLVTGAVQIVFWLAVPVLPFGALLAAAFLSGALMVPAQPVTRQAIAAMTPQGLRRAAFALEAVQGEISYIAGPPLAILCAAQFSPGAVAWGTGAAIVAGGAGVALLDPPLRAPHEKAAEQSEKDGPGERPRRREWLGPRMTATLLMAFGTTVLLAGVDLAIVAALKEDGQVSWAAAVVAVFGVTSVVGGLVHGSLPRALPAWVMLAGVGLAIAPAGLAPDGLWLCAVMAVAGLLVAPTLSTLSDTVSRLAPARVRGEATGLQSSALSAGFALGTPLAGTAVDATAAAGGFVAAGLAGVLAALAGRLLSRGPRAGRTRGGEEAPAAGASAGRSADAGSRTVSR